ETESTFYQVKDDETTYVVGKVSFNESGLKEIKKSNPKHVKQPTVEKTHPKSLELQKTQDATVDEHGRGHQRHHSVGPFLPTPKSKIIQGNFEIPQNSVQEKSRDENSNFLAALPEWKPAGDYDFHPGYDHDDNETDNNPDLFPNFDVKMMEADMVVDTPFLFMVVSESDGGSTTKKLIHFVGRFTGVDEVVDSTILKSFQQPKKTV
uniref:Uncharacterized protein n=1 Tax=Panagrolaimus sp. JU765 TaxID=591449 RepID=A0AC34RRC3_9BILA